MRITGVAAVAAAAALALSSCTPSYDDDTRDGLRQYVVAVSEASAAGDWSTALNGLDSLADEATAAREAGQLDDARFESITLAMELVRQDLEAAIAAAEDEAERQRLQEEQARLQEQITQMQNQDTGGESGDDSGGESGDGGGKGGDKGGDKGKGEGKGEK